MVWGICWPRALGKYRPLGDFEAPSISDPDGWLARLKGYALNEMSEADREAIRKPDHQDDHAIAAYYSSVVYYKFSCELGSIPPLISHPITKIEQHEVPGDFFAEKNIRDLGDLVKLSGILAVSDPLLRLIEELEPSVHKSFETKIINPNGSAIEGYHLLIINQYFDSVIPDDVIVPSGNQPLVGRQSWKLEDKPNIRKLRFNSSKFSGAHLWMDRRLARHLICVSDQLMDAIEEAGLVIPKHAKAREV